MGTLVRSDKGELKPSDLPGEADVRMRSHPSLPATLSLSLPLPFSTSPPLSVSAPLFGLYPCLFLCLCVFLSERVRTRTVQVGGDGMEYVSHSAMVCSGFVTLVGLM